jgi:hypothetical protein
MSAVVARQIIDDLDQPVSGRVKEYLVAAKPRRPKPPLMAIDSIREALNAVPRFWPALRRAFDLQGFDEDYVRRLVPISLDAPSKYIKDKV